jgi:phosphatidylcholine synthase
MGSPRFPSYWNVAALYVFYLQPAPMITAASVLLLSVLTLIPTRYLYPSMGGTLNRIAVALAGIWVIVLLVALLEIGPTPVMLVTASLFFPTFYMLASWWVELAGQLR